MRVRAAVWHGAGDVRVEQVALPEEPPAGWLRVRVAWCGLCGSDTLEYARGPVVIPAAPLVLGHEISGTVAALGAGVDGLAAGDRVVTDTLVPCGECVRCRRGEVNLCPRLRVVGLSVDGGLAEYVDVPADSCVRLAAAVPLDVAALTEPLAVAVRAARRARSHAATAVVGAGMVGLLLAAVLGDLTYVEPQPDRRAVAERWTGAPAVATVGELAPPDEPCTIFECSGSVDALTDIVATAPAGSLVVLVGVHGHRTPLDLHRLLHKEIELVGSLSHDRTDFADAAARIAERSDHFMPLVGRRADLDSVPDVLRALTGDASPAGKVLVGPEGEAWTSS